MNKEDPYRDQAEKLRKKIKRTTFEEGKSVEKEELPPRSRVHQKGKKNKWKVKYPVIRLLVLFFILLPVTVISIYSTIAKDRISNVKETIGESTEEFETIDIEEDSTKKDDGEKNPAVEEQDTSENGLEQGMDSSKDETQSKGTEESQDGAENSQGAAAPLTVQEKDIVYHKVKQNDTLYRISMKYYKSKSGIDTIKYANNLSNNEIRIGQVLTIPLNK